MHRQYFISDPHFGHHNILKFTDDKGKLTRPGFETIEEMDELIIENCNKVIRPCDKLYILGDVSMYRRCLPILDRLIGKKYLIRGNHDIFKLKDYIPYFKDIRAYKIYPKYGIICSHIPIHPRGLEGRFNLNVHGHTHQNIIDDPRYLNICCERINYKPISLEEILERKSNV
jgi:calcineurin-like phosphoesterase family protein